MVPGKDEDPKTCTATRLFSLGISNLSHTHWHSKVRIWICWTYLWLAWTHRILALTLVTTLTIHVCLPPTGWKGLHKARAHPTLRHLSSLRPYGPIFAEFPPSSVLSTGCPVVVMNKLLQLMQERRVALEAVGLLGWLRPESYTRPGRASPWGRSRIPRGRPSVARVTRT